MNSPSLHHSRDTHTHDTVCLHFRGEDESSEANADAGLTVTHSSLKQELPKPKKPRFGSSRIYAPNNSRRLRLSNDFPKAFAKERG